MNYNDLEILDYVSENNEEAVELLYKKYEPLIKKMSRKMYLYCSNLGIDLSDLEQEGRIALNDAINTYKDNKEASFFTYASVCINKRLISFVNGAKRLKHKILNDSISLDMEKENGTTLENFFSNEIDNPEVLFLSKEFENETLNKIRSVLTDFEIQVFELRYNNFDYKEIANILDKTPKSIDNAIQRIKLKTKKIIFDKEK